MAEQKIALITGANKGIGKEIARQLGGRGTEAAGELTGQGITAHAILLDVTEAASIAAAAQQIERDFGRLDVLVTTPSA